MFNIWKRKKDNPCKGMISENELVDLEIIKTNNGYLFKEGCNCYVAETLEELSKIIGDIFICAYNDAILNSKSKDAHFKCTQVKSKV